MVKEKNLNIYSNRLIERANNPKYCLNTTGANIHTSPTQEGSFDFVWDVEEGVHFIPRNLTSVEMGLVDTLLDFFNRGRVFNLSIREIESYLRDENHLRAFPETFISEKLIHGWIRDLVKGYYSSSVAPREFQGDFSTLGLLEKIRGTKELLRTLHFNHIKVELIEIEDLDFVFKVEVDQLAEGLALEGFSSFWQEYLRAFFKNDELIVQIEKNL